MNVAEGSKRKAEAQQHKNVPPTSHPTKAPRTIKLETHKHQLSVSRMTRKNQTFLSPLKRWSSYCKFGSKMVRSNYLPSGESRHRRKWRIRATAAFIGMSVIQQVIALLWSTYSRKRPIQENWGQKEYTRILSQSEPLRSLNNQSKKQLNYWSSMSANCFICQNLKEGTCSRLWTI